MCKQRERERERDDVTVVAVNGLRVGVLSRLDSWLVCGKFCTFKEKRKPQHKTRGPDCFPAYTKGYRNTDRCAPSFTSLNSVQYNQAT